MALSIIQTPSDPALANSPVIFAVTGGLYVTQSRFQYLADLYVWSGSDSQSGSAVVTFAKYPNAVNGAIFDVGTMVSAKLNDLALTTLDNTKKFKAEFYEQWYTQSQYLQTPPLASAIYKAVDGYGIAGESVNPSPATLSPYWPILTSGPATQSFISGATGPGCVWSGSADEIEYTDEVTTIQHAYTLAGGAIQSFPLFPSDPGFPYPFTPGTGYSVQAKLFGAPVGKPLYIYEECESKWGNVRIQWKNRWGRFDYMDFSLKNIETITAERNVYRPSVGSWNASTLTVQPYDSYQKVFNTQATTRLLVNTPYVEEEWNTNLKELMLSDEIYWNKGGEYIALVLDTQNVQLLTGRNDKLIQYTMVFSITRPLKQEF
jgi:hypothetical protein